MGHKVQPTGFRLGTTEEWRSRWYADKNYAQNLGNDIEIRTYLEKRLASAALSRVDIERGGDKVKITIMFRGREQSRPELGMALLQRLANDVIEFGYVESAPKQDGRNMLMVLAPTRKKAEARAEGEAAKEARMSQRKAAAEEEARQLAEHRAAEHAAAQPKKKRGPADNLDPDIDL